ncbi:MAG TPA: chlorosome envelope protein I [Chlorobaculum sp.]|uniref:2Fe-2S iron-sulfur cluster-binding protein n=1 Tax=Chlorobaculum tepidum TaxID=1097 RepID=UPI00001621F6|nr:2Fe-2S iron-sulfur cluster-binding protein [Chlorobaculum tepidum]AAM72611.1 chlorosome envelope protein I [Chlorobaculum tepidum TLS]HBU24531.1 chlorosome envelope protein I [Chlorobaculum sp.]
MNLIINDKTASSSVGQTIGKAARLNHAHVGYVCGGHGLCQACYITVQEGADCLAPLTDVEKAFLSPRQIAAGGRMACQATIAKEGTVKVLSRPEEVRRMVFSNPFQLIGYAADMGKDTAQQIVPGVQNLIGRIQRGEMGGKDALGDMIESIQGAAGLVVEAIQQGPMALPIPFKEQIADLISKLPLPQIQLPSISLPQLPSISFPQLPFSLPKLPFSLPFLPQQPQATASLEKVTITVQPPAKD